MRILLAVDDSKFSEAATQAVILQATKDTDIRVLHVIEPISHMIAGGMAGYDPSLDAAAAAESKQAEALVAKTAELLRSKGLKATSATDQGDPKSKIIDIATEWHADLIVMGSHGRKGLGRFLMGSVSSAVANHAPCSVEIVRTPSSR
jgi:nucleotide-binding universal stress UspA family protein